jgi:hypothetical protein
MGLLSNRIIIKVKQNMSLHTYFLRPCSVEYRITKETGIMFTDKDSRGQKLFTIGLFRGTFLNWISQTDFRSMLIETG